LFQYVRHIDLLRRDDQQQEELEQALPYPGKFFINAHPSVQSKLPLCSKVAGCPKWIKEKKLEKSRIALPSIYAQHLPMLARGGLP
jgi:hypothetical protein